MLTWVLLCSVNENKSWAGEIPAQPSSSKNPMADILAVLPQAGAAGAAIIVVWMFLGHVKELVELFRLTIEDLRNKFAVDLKDARQTFSSELKDTRTSFNDQITQNRNTFAVELQTVTTKFSDRYQSIQDTFKELHTDQIRSSQQTIDTIREIREALKDLREKK